MAMAQRQKTLIIALALYWPTIFVLTHIPVPEVVRQAHMSDKSLHFLAYMVLAFLLWSALRPFEKAAWRRPAIWRALAIVMVYAVCDEYLQRFVAGRSPDLEDLLANAIGACVGLAVAAVVSFWPGSVIVTGTTIFTLTVFTRANLTRLLPVTSAALHLATYGLFTLLWIGCLDRSPSGQKRDRIWSIRSLAGPAALLLVTKVGAIVSGKEVEGAQVVAGAGGIAGAMVIVALWRSLRPRNAKAAGLSAADA